MPKDTRLSDLVPQRPGFRARMLLGFPLIAAAFLTYHLAMRPVASYDVGYHLMYGREFLRTGRIVQTNRFVYTKLDPAVGAEPDRLPPGCRYDPASNTYSFVNANWLSQVAMAGVHRLGGWKGLTILGVVMVLAVVSLGVTVLRRHGVGGAWAGAVILLAVMTAYERFDVRPESFGYLLLAGQWAMLVGPGFGPRRAAGVIALQALAVNCHSYFLLGPAIAAAMFAEALMRYLWARTVTRTDTKRLRPLLKWLGVAAGGAVLACLVNPWFVRGAVFPIRTMLYLRRHDIIGAAIRPGVHPWALIEELRPSLASSQFAFGPTYALVAVLVLAGLAVVPAAMRRRWGRLAVMAGLAAASVSIRRNIALAGFFVAPLAAISLAEGAAMLAPALRGARLRLAGRLASAAVALVATVLGFWWGFAVLSNDFYVQRHRKWRHGIGVSRVMVPIDAADWIMDHRPPGRVWCDFANSSNLLFCTGGAYEVPVLTNTWAMPPEAMWDNMLVAASVKPLAPVVRAYDVNTVVLRCGERISPLMGRLARDPGWAVVQIGVRHAVFLRRTGAPDLARECAILPETFEAEAFVGQIIEQDPGAKGAWREGVRLLEAFGWTAAAEAVHRELDKRGAPR